MRRLNGRISEQGSGTTLGCAGFSACFRAEASVLREDPSQRGERWKYVHPRDNTG